MLRLGPSCCLSFKHLKEEKETILFTLNTSLFNRLGTPLVMDQFGWSESEAILYLGILMTVGGAISVVTFAAVGPLAKR